MLSSYRAILATRGATAFSATGTLARLPLSMTGLGIVLLVYERTGRYGTAGALAAVYVLVASVSGPLQGRLADQLGQSPVLWVAGATHATGIGLTLGLSGASAPWPYVAVAVAGAGAPQAGNLVRARWAHVLTDRRRLDTAFALEAVLDEVVFVIGPVLVTFLTLQVADYSGLLVSGVVSTLASWGLALQRSTEPPPSPRTGQPSSPIGLPLLVPLTAAAIGIGVLFGSTEVIVVAFTEEAGRDHLAGVILAIWAGGSLIAGLLVGALPAAEPLRRFRWSVTGLAVLFIPLGLLDSVELLAIGMLAAGFMISPTVIAMTRLVEIGTPARRFTEALSWVNTGLASGVALGAAVVGQVIDARGASAGFVVALSAVAMASVIAWTLVQRRHVTTPVSGYGGS